MLCGYVCCAASQKAYWDIKQKFMDTILFYKIGKVCCSHIMEQPDGMQPCCTCMHMHTYPGRCTAKPDPLR
jgi:hypothetical protein